MRALDMLDGCPCCGHRPAVADELVADLLACPCCDHRWRAVAETEANTMARYAHQQDRNSAASPYLERKLVDRLAALRSLLRPGQRILEIGCAEGALGERVKQCVALEYAGVEISMDAEAAKRRLDRVWRVPAAQVDDGPYDLLLAFHVLEHIADPDRELEHWRRLLLPTGRLVMEVPHRAGHPLLERDRHREHLHQFSIASLAVLLERRGFVVEQLGTGHFESPMYSDSIRVVARLQLAPEQRRHLLLDRLRPPDRRPWVIYGCGGDFANYIAPLVDALPVAALVDSDPGRQGQALCGFQVEAYCAERHGRHPVLIASLRNEADIRDLLKAAGHPENHTFGLADIFPEQS